MKKNRIKLIVICGMTCILLLLISSYYAVTFNDSRLVVPMDLEAIHSG